MRKFIIIGATLAALVVPSVANASVAVENGVGTVGKGDVQSALKWNNKEFDNGALKLQFTTGASTAERVNVDYPMVCMNVTNGAMTSGGHRLIIQPGTVAMTITNTPIYNAGNGKQITGFKLTSAPGTFKAVGNAVVRDVTCGENTVLVMNEGTATQPKTVTVTGASTDGLKVNGVSLPNTPVEITA